ncbi:MAG: hypothetical protein ACE5FH_13160 [Candidatus Zixiibacteriota bacterium]
MYHWRNGDLGSSYLFDADVKGREYFARYLRETANTPVYVLVDLFEEEFKQDTIPHVFGSDRTAILARKKGRLFRDTPYFYHRIQGREEEGRRDDRVLMTAIVNSDLVSPWIALLDQAKAPVAGIYSVPLLAESLARQLPGQSDNMLIVSLQSISGLRQTYIYNREFRISRLVQMPRYGTAPYTPYILAAGELKDDLRKEHRDSSLIKYHVLDFNDLLAATGSQRKVSTPFSDQLFAHHLLKTRPRNFYATATDRRYFSVRRMRYSMITTSAVLLLCAAGWGGFNLMDGMSFKQQSLAAQKKAEFYKARYQMAKDRLLHTPVEPADLEVAVDIAEILLKHKTSPIEILAVISKGLSQHPTIQIDDIKWVASTKPDTNIDGTPAVQTPGNPYAQPYTPISGANYRLYQIAQVAGHLDPFDSNYRNAITTINTFAETLRGFTSVHDVEVLELPLDISSNASLRGDAQSKQAEAKFSVRVVLGIGHEA